MEPANRNGPVHVVCADDLAGRVAVVTGGGRGLGRVTALALLKAGASVMITSRDRQTLAETVASSGADSRAAFVVADIATQAGCDALVEAAIDTFGHVDILFNNAGLGPPDIKTNVMAEPYGFWEVDRETLERFHAINSVTPVVLAGMLVPSMIERGWGRIVNDTTSLSTMLFFTAYGGSKASLEAHTACMARDLEGTGVTANVLVPGGAAATRMGEGLGIRQDQMIDPSVMAGPSVWLASAASDGVNGRRFVASRWDFTLPPDEAAKRAGAPVAWLG